MNEIENFIGFAAGFLILLWAFAVRRSRFDSILLGLTGLLVMVLGLGWHSLHFRTFYLLEALLGALGVALLVRALMPRGRREGQPAGGAPATKARSDRVGEAPGQRPPVSGASRIGFGVLGCVVLVPALLLAALVGAFMIGGIDYQERARERIEQADNAAAEMQVKARLDRPETARFRNQRRPVRNEVGTDRVQNAMCGEYMAAGMRGYRGYIYIPNVALLVADERGMLRFTNGGYPVYSEQQLAGGIHDVPWSAFCGDAGPVGAASAVRKYAAGASNRIPTLGREGMS